MTAAASTARPRSLLLLLAPMLLASLLTPSLAVSDHGLPQTTVPVGADWDWEFLNLWPRLLHIRRQFDRDGFPLQTDGEPPAVTGTGNKSGVLRTLELEDEDGGYQTAAVAHRRPHSDGPTPRDEAVARTLGPLITPIANTQLSAECYRDSQKYIQSIFTELWALRMFDATGKLPDGVLIGNVYPMGNWDECLNTTAHYTTTNPITKEKTEHSFDGKYCADPGGAEHLMESAVLKSASDNWWKNMLYINNLVDMDRQCIGQTWYLANDMQMFLFSPLVLLPLYHWPVLGQLWIIFLLCFFSGINAMVTVIHNLGPTGSLPDGDNKNFRYQRPWARIGPYLVGLYMGWILHKIRGRKIVLPAPLVAIGWLTSSLTACLIVYGLYDQPTVPPQTTNIIYPMLSRTAWSVCLAWVVFACVTGYGGVVNSILSWKALIPFSRLTYTSYLVSIDVQLLYWLTSKSPQYLDHLVLVYQFLGSLPVIFTVATVFSLAFESPMLALEKLIFPQPSRAAPAAAASKGPTADDALLKTTEPGAVGWLEHVNKAFEGEGDGPPASAELHHDEPGSAATAGTEVKG
ncbi:Nose resistant to fluoxetine protein 6 [Amphibalanus amphitrite]|uniref:Nose resistant to fluoxetine protein 6 n=1 Tax=Amphibalanus amphitrite TaxID=1232801 RepID=A0A6A4VDY5_AMPAM|nr:Nose resistant to fluoxetine protein 6 [Amphibalanus amphitrite]